MVAIREQEPWRRVAAVLGASGVGLAMLGALPAAIAERAQPPSSSAPALASPATPKPPSSSIAAKAYAALDAHCARCHQMGRAPDRRQAGRLANILDLDELARQPEYVRPGVPDGSRLYTAMLDREMPPDANHGAAAKTPNAAEVQAVRDWIEGLPPSSGACPGRAFFGAEAIAASIAGALRTIAPAEHARQRFVTLAHLRNACATDTEMGIYRAAIGTLLGSLTLKNEPPRLQPIDPEMAVLRLDLADLGWPPSTWDRLAQGYPFAGPGAIEAIMRQTGASQPALPGDWLAAVATAAPLGRELLGSDTAAARSRAALDEAAAHSDSTLFGLDPVSALAHQRRREVALPRAAADLGLAPEQFASRLEVVPAELLPVARRLRQATVTRADADLLLAAMAGASAKGPINGADPSGPPEDRRGLVLTIWTEHQAYKAGELLTIFASTTADCRLTLINVDRAGKAIVLLPNELEQNNLLTAGQNLQVPMAGAPYQLRLTELGRETIIGLCAPPGAAAVTGIGHDFARQRFTVLGDWRSFLLRAFEENAEHRSEDAKPSAASGRAKRTPRPGASDPSVDAPRASMARAIITIDVP